jgi:predicted ATPase/class 3 adenylate cyclase
MTILPSGTVTFLFTDIEGSTKLAQKYPEAMPGLLARHNEIVIRSIEAYDGYIFQNIGDAFCAAFSSALDAVSAALEAQKCLYRESWSPAPVKVRMGIHSGEAHADSEGKYSGYTTMALTERIMSAGHGGQVLLSGAARELVRDVLPENVVLSDLGEKRLKDLLRPEHLYQLNISGLPSTFPPLKTLDTFPNNLPRQLTTFIGRENEIAEVKQELEQHRLVTLTGSGGTGKTRLSLQVAADLLESFDHGVWFVELAPLADPDRIPRTILTTLGILEQPSKTSLQVLQEYFQDRQVLVLLDNCEHLIDASARVAETLLSAAPRLKILASSREALRIAGEASYPVPSLDLPDIRHLPLIEQMSQYEAVRLFIDRAMLVLPHFVVDQDNAPYIAQICYRLDGIPLAIELAAARVRVLSVKQISIRLDDRFRLLTGGARTALPRQQTLRALIDWSYDLLTDNERSLLRRLSVFAGGWTLDAAEQVCTGDGIETEDVLDLLTQLLNKSLVILVENTQSGETRYRMLETIRQYAREKLLEAGDGESVRDRHLVYFVTLAERADHELYRANQTFWYQKLDDELDNLRMAIEWALGTDGKSGLRIIYALRHFLESHGVLREAAAWLAELLEKDQDADVLHALAQAVYAFCLFRQGNFPLAIQLAEQSLLMARAAADRHAEAFSLSFLGLFTLTQGNVREGITILEQSLALFKELGDKVYQAIVMEWLAVNSGDVTRGITYARESLRLYRELGSVSDIVSCLCQLARVTIWQGDLTSPGPWLEEAKSLSGQLDNRSSRADVMMTYGSLAYWQGDHQQAYAYYEEGSRLSDEAGNYFYFLWGQVNLAYCALRLGDAQRARQLFAESIRTTQRAHMEIAQVFAIEGLGSLHAGQGQPRRAACLFAWAYATRERTGDYGPPVEQRSIARELEVIHLHLDETEFNQAWSEGSAMTLDDAVACALDENHE